MIPYWWTFVFVFVNGLTGFVASKLSYKSGYKDAMLRADDTIQRHMAREH